MFLHNVKDLNMRDRMTQSAHNFRQLFFINLSIAIFIIQVEAIFEHYTNIFRVVNV